MTETNSVAVSVSGLVTYPLKFALPPVIQRSQEKTTLQDLPARQLRPTLLTRCVLISQLVSGRTSPVNEVKIMSEDQCVQPPGCVGEVWL